MGERVMAKWLEPVSELFIRCDTIAIDEERDNPSPRRLTDDLLSEWEP